MSHLVCMHNTNTSLIHHGQFHVNVGWLFSILQSPGLRKHYSEWKFCLIIHMSTETPECKCVKCWLGNDSNVIRCWLRKYKVSLKIPERIGGIKSVLYWKLSQHRYWLHILRKLILAPTLAEKAARFLPLEKVWMTQRYRTKRSSTQG